MKRYNEEEEEIINKLRMETLKACEELMETKSKSTEEQKQKLIIVSQVLELIKG